jgi:DNA-binding PadR family transcriptional regulator
MPASSGDATPRMMVLGLVIQQSDTAAGVARRLAEQFASARFPRSSAHKNLPNLAERGYLRLVERGAEPSLDRYEATQEGVEHLRGWLRSSTLPPTIRDALQGKLEFLGLEDLVALVRVVREEEKAYSYACDIAHARVLQEQRSRRRLGGGIVDWRLRLRGIQSKDEATLWSMMSQRLERLLGELEELLEEVSAAPRVDGG